MPECCRPVTAGVHGAAGLEPWAGLKGTASVSRITSTGL